MTRKNINDVLGDCREELMAVPDVAGVCIGLHPDDGLPCLKVLVVKETEEHRQRVPGSIEGYPVVIEESGNVRPI